MAKAAFALRSWIAGTVLVLVGGVALAATAAGWRIGAPDVAAGWLNGWGWVWGVMAGGFLVLAALWVLQGLLDSHFDDLERLRLALLVAGESPDHALPTLQDETRDGAVAMVWRAADFLNTARLLDAEALSRRLGGVLSAVEEAIVVTRTDGLVMLANVPAKAVLGADTIAVGTSVFAALERDGLAGALDAARTAAVPQNWTLAHVDGRAFEATVVSLPHDDAVLIRLDATALPAETAGSLEHDFTLLDQPLQPTPVTAATPLDRLGVLVFDSETTGLDVTTDRMISLGGVALVGRAAATERLDRLIHPGVPIPKTSTAIHGIDDDMVADAPGFAAVYPDFQGAVAGRVLVGHNIGFDAAILAAECDRAGLTFTPPVLLDTLTLYAALFPSETELNLETLARRFSIPVEGRHTALGDALVTAEVYVRLLPLLADAGVRTLGEARAFAAQATRVTQRQQLQGWHAGAEPEA